MTWDREEGALFVCIVMDYYPLGDLEMCVRKKRENKEKFDELILKKWIGQMLDAITFVHEKVRVGFKGVGKDFLCLYFEVCYFA